MSVLSEGGLNIYLASLVIYSIVLVAAGAFLSRSVRRASDFLVAGRRLGPGLIFSTFLAANIGAGSTVNAATLGYTLGLSAWWWVGSAGIGCLILANTVGPRIWRLAHAENFQTLGDFLERRYSREVRGLISAILWVGTLGLLAAQLIALSILLDVTMGVPRWLGSVLSGLVVIFYFAAGGLLSSAWINMLQLVVLLAGFFLAVPFALGAGGGWAAVSGGLAAKMGAQAQSYLALTGIGGAGVLYYAALLVPSFIVSPGLIQKIYGARSVSAARWGVNANAMVLLVYAFVPTLLGMTAALLFPSLGDPQYALFRIMTEALPAWLGVLGIAAIFSAELSTCDAVLFMLSSSLTIDLYRTFLNPASSERRLLQVSRGSAVAAGAAGVLISVAVPSIIGALTIFYSLVSVALFVPVVAGLYSRRPTARAALAAIAVSVPATLLIHFGVGEVIFGIMNPFLAGILISFVVLWALTPAK